MATINYTDLATITVLVDANPKREGTASHTRFAAYRSGMTVAEARKANGKKVAADLRWETARGFIKVDEPGKVEAKVENNPSYKAPAKRSKK